MYFFPAIERPGDDMAYSIYNNVISQLAANYTPTKQIVHSKSELQELSSRIKKNNSNSPLFILNMNDSSEEFVLGAKESAVSLYQFIDELQDPDASVFLSKRVTPDKKGVLESRITNAAEDHEEDPVTIKLHSLATTQFNVGESVVEGAKNLIPGDYRFNITINEEPFAFHFTVGENNRNDHIIHGLTDFINKAGIGVKAGFTPSGENRLSMTLESEETGAPSMLTFTFEDTEFPNFSRGLTEYFGLNNVVRFPENAKFSVNGEEKESLNNHITLNRIMKIDFIEPSDEEVTISFERDADKVLSSLDGFVADFNNAIDSFSNINDSKINSSAALRRITAPVLAHAGELRNVGIEVGEDGKLSIDREAAESNIINGTIPDLFIDSDFISSFKSEIGKVATDPVQFVNKTIVAYPNVQHPAPLQPYVSSMYSGMLFNAFL